MAFFALADLHLGFSVDKPMDIFGDQWIDHPAKIEAGWRATVGEDDVVLLAGDISWGMTLEEAAADLDFIHRLPGRKIMIRGNHDYWWSSANKVRRALPPSIRIVHHDYVVVDDFVVAGTRGWNIPVPEICDDDVEADAKIFERERGRLELAFRGIPKDKPLIAMMHYPPFFSDIDHVGYTDILEAAGARMVVYGHLHGEDHALAFNGVRHGVRYVFCAADGVDFTPVRLEV
ncbi:MAG: metallophosphoesterase [Deltaproteobacteria bacterium]|nr:metallophosphoesterase [Deltaproteobacteria bacterium]